VSLNELDRVLKLLSAQPVIRMLRDGGRSWEEIAFKFKKRGNPLGLSPRQLARIYEGPDAYGFDSLKKVVKRLG